jgi:hypothetical protein
MISEDTTNAVRRKVVVSLFEQPIPRLPELTAFAWLHRREFFKVATDRVDEYRYHQAFQALQFRAGAASSPTSRIDARISRSVPQPPKRRYIVPAAQSHRYWLRMCDRLPG